MLIMVSRDNDKNKVPTFPEKDTNSNRSSYVQYILRRATLVVLNFLNIDAAATFIAEVRVFRERAGRDKDRKER